MAWMSSALLMMAIIFSTWYGSCLSCDVVELSERVNDPPLYTQQQAPSAVAKRLGFVAAGVLLLRVA